MSSGGGAGGRGGPGGRGGGQAATPPTPPMQRAAADTTPIKSRDEWKRKVMALVDEWLELKSEEEAEGYGYPA